MNIRQTFKLQTLGATLALCATAMLASAQTAPSMAMPQAKPAKPAKANAAPAKGVIGSGSGPILSREELRACLKRESDVRTRIDAHEKQRAELDADKQAIVTDQQALRTEREPVDAVKRDIDGLSGEMKAYSERVADFNKKSADFSEAGTRASKTELAELNTEREALEKQRVELDERKTRLTGQSGEVVKTYNVRAVALDAKVNDWNQRNAAWNQQAPALETERTEWIAACSDRRYREDDETAIKRGQ